MKPSVDIETIVTKLSDRGVTGIKSTPLTCDDVRCQLCRQISVNNNNIVVNVTSTCIIECGILSNADDICDIE